MAMPIKLAVNSCEKRCEIFFSKKLNLIFLKPSIVITRKHDLGKWERMARRNNKNWEKERDEASHVCFFFLPSNRCSQRPFLLYGKMMCVCVCAYTEKWRNLFHAWFTFSLRAEFATAFNFFLNILQPPLYLWWRRWRKWRRVDLFSVSDDRDNPYAFSEMSTLTRNRLIRGLD